MEPDNPLLDDFVLGLTGKTCPRVCFVPTASGDSEESIELFHRAFGDDRCDASHLSLFRERPADLRRFLLDQDVIYVGGGNTFNLLALWRAHGLVEVMREAWEAGVVLSGLSAGSLCWFECGVTDSFGPLRPLCDGLGLLPGSHCPHYDGEPERRPAYHRFVADGLPGGVAADDGVGLHYVGTELFGAVTSRPGARAYRVEPVDGRVVETAIAARPLGGPAQNVRWT